MKKICIKILTCALIALCMVSTVSMLMPVKAAGIEPYSYEKTSFTFKGTTYLARDMTGTFMDVKVRGTASNNNNETITLEIYVENTNKTHTYVFLTDGQTHTYKNIFLGFGGGSGVRFGFTGANPAREISMNLEAGS